MMEKLNCQLQVMKIVRRTPLQTQDLSLYSTATQKHLHWVLESVALGKPTCWYVKTPKFASPPTHFLKFALAPCEALAMYISFFVC